MKKFFLLLLIFLSAPAYAGTFYVNVVISGADYSSVNSYLEKNGYEAYTADLGNGYTIVYEKKIDDQYEADGEKFCSSVTSVLNCTAVYSLVHDSDVLYMKAYSNGNEIFSYNSFPGYFDEGTSHPEIRGLDALLEVFKKNSVREKLAAVLTDVGEKYIFADDRHAEIAGLLGFASDLIHAGYSILSQVSREDPAEFKKTFRAINVK